jgi:enoyl-CoA hydratase/carnithine racemase
VLACEMRFASRQKAIFGNPEIGVGLLPGGGALEWLPRMVGRSRALEISLSGDDFDADVAERYGWVNRTLDDAELDNFVDRLARRLASFGVRAGLRHARGFRVELRPPAALARSRPDIRY